MYVASSTWRKLLTQAPCSDTPHPHLPPSPATVYSSPASASCCTCTGSYSDTTGGTLKGPAMCVLHLDMWGVNTQGLGAGGQWHLPVLGQIALRRIPHGSLEGSSRTKRTPVSHSSDPLKITPLEPWRVPLVTSAHFPQSPLLFSGVPPRINIRSQATASGTAFLRWHYAFRGPTVMGNIRWAKGSEVYSFRCSSSPWHSMLEVNVHHSHHIIYNSTHIHSYPDFLIHVRSLHEWEEGTVPLKSGFASLQTEASPLPPPVQLGDVFAVNGAALTSRGSHESRWLSLHTKL